MERGVKTGMTKIEEAIQGKK